jgi:two-component system cell cycle response regulator
VAAFPGVDGAIARRIGERLRRNVGEHPFPIATEDGPLAVTISIGSATTSGRDDTADALLERADSALYRAKKEGRNRVVAYA